MGLEDDFKDVEKDMTGQGGSDGQNNSTDDGGKKTEDTLADSAIDYVAGKEGVNAGFDPEINNIANDAINKF